MNKVVSCEACQTMISSVREWCEDIVCPKLGAETWHKKACIMGNCKECDVKKLGICNSEIESETPMSWQTFEYAQLEKSGKRKKVAEVDDKPGKRLRMVYKETTMAEFLQKVNHFLSCSFFEFSYHKNSSLSFWFLVH